MTCHCDCCRGTGFSSASMIENRYGLSHLHFRIATHASFLGAMKARLSSSAYPQLQALTTREPGDFSIALLDAWATLGDVLTFYQERIANEGYLRTATERRSVLELARLIGYAPRPGVAASVYLAYALDKDSAPVEIPKGARANSIPAPGEQMQAFETAEPLQARAEWNAIKPRLTQPQTAASIWAQGLYLAGTATKLKANDPFLINLGGGLKFYRAADVEVNDEGKWTRIELPKGSGFSNAVSLAAQRLSLFGNHGLSEKSDIEFVRTFLNSVVDAAYTNGASAYKVLTGFIASMEAPAANETLDGQTPLGMWLGKAQTAFTEILQKFPELSKPVEPTPDMPDPADPIAGLITRLTIAPSLQPKTELQLPRDVAILYGPNADTAPQLLTALVPSLATSFYSAWHNLPSVTPQSIEMHALRISAAPFGHNAPLRLLAPVLAQQPPTMGEWRVDEPWNLIPGPIGDSPGSGNDEGAESASNSDPLPSDFHTRTKVCLDNDYDLAPDSVVVIETRGWAEVLNPVVSMRRHSMAAYGLSGKSVSISWSDRQKIQGWVNGSDGPFSVVRNARIHAGSEKLELAEVPILSVIEGKEIELGALYADLQPGRWIIIEGERSDIFEDDKVASGVRVAELAMISAVSQRTKPYRGGFLPGDQVHTFLTLAESLAYRFKRDTVTIHANVVKATHGETRSEVMGSGNAAEAFQQFALKQPPLTFISAATASGIESTLEVRVNDVKWHETPSLAALGANDRNYVGRIDDDGKTSVAFGDGKRGLRLPTGLENIKAVYRNGIGRPGNVKARQISLLASRPLGVKEVINPIRASGGADREGRDSIRSNAPLAVTALERLVSTLDYADFARTFAGVGKAVSARLTDGRRQTVQVTIAGADDIPIEKRSDLYRNLKAALHRFGDPYLPINLAVRERLALVISANVKIGPDYRWDLLEPKIRAVMLEAFSFERAELGQDLLLSNAISALQKVRGVDYADVDVFAALSEQDIINGFTQDIFASHRKNQTRLLNKRIKVEAARIATETRKILPAQLAFLTPEVPDTLILQEVTP